MTPGAGAWADAPALAGEGHKVVVPTVTAAGTRKAVRKDAAFEVFAQGLSDVGLWGVVVTLTIELAGAGQVKPGLEVLGYRLVEKGSLGVARVIEFGFGC